MASAISKVKRDLAIRSRVVVRFAERMFTWASERTMVMSESRRARSRASTWMLTRNVDWAVGRSEEHTSELQSRLQLVCRLLLEKKKVLLTGPLVLPPEVLAVVMLDIVVATATIDDEFRALATAVVANDPLTRHVTEESTPRVMA